MRAIQEITRTARTLQTFALRALTALLLLGTVVVPLQSARADGTTYSTTRRQFKVGILLVDSTNQGNGPENPDPFVFQIAEDRKDLKPQNWEFVNPLAPGVVTADIRDRWLLRDPNQPYQLGQKVTKTMAAYWEVSLTKSTVQELVQFDLLYIHSHRKVGFNPADRERLRKLVDAGGVIWIENCGGMYIESKKPFFLEQLQFRTQNLNGNNAPYVYQPDHPILNSPYQLSLDEIRGLGENKIARGFYLTTINPAQPDPNNGLDIAPNPETLINIVGTTAARDPNNRYMPYIAAGNYGSGAVIATGGDTGCDINDRCGGTFTSSGGNSGAIAGTNIDAAHNEDLKFLYNMVAWGSQATTDRRNNRRTASSFDSVGAPLVTNFNFDNAFTRAVRPADIVNSESAPLIVKNALFVAGQDPGGATIRCYDTQPFADLDGDGNFDEGLPDISIGLPYDEVWRVAPGGNGPPSSPVYAPVLLANGQHDDRIFVSLADGTLVILRAFAKSAEGSLLPAPVVVQTVAGAGTYTNGMPAPAPVFYENRIYQVLPNGLVRCVDARDGTVLFTSFQTAPTNAIIPMGTPTLGIVRQTGQTVFAQSSNENTNDIMLYVPAVVTENGTNVGKVFAYWLGTRNEVQRNFAPPPAGQNGIMNTRVAGGQGGPGAGWYYVAAGQSAVTAFRQIGGTFLRPNVRVFSSRYDGSGTVIASAKEQYAKGDASDDYYRVIRQPDNNNGSDVWDDGTVHLEKRGGLPNYIPNAGPDADILISVDYDVVYIPANGNPPQNYAQNQTQVGARPNNVLNVPFLAGNPLFTSALAPDDSLLFTALQAWNGNINAPAPEFASVQAINEQEGDASGSTSRVRWKFNLFDKFTDTQAANDLLYVADVDNVTVTDIVPLTNRWIFDPGWPQASLAVKAQQAEALRNVRTVGAPVTTNDGITYVMARANSNYNSRISGGEVTVIMAFKSNPVVTLTVPEPFDEAAGVTISQADLLSDPDNPATIAASSNRTLGPNFTLDGDQARITITNFRVGGKSFSASQSFVVRYTPRTTREERRVVVPPIPLAVLDTFGLPTDATRQVTANSGGFTPLLFYYVLPGAPARNASPNLIGDLIYYPMTLGGRTGAPFMVAVNARPQDTDPKVRGGFGEQVYQVTAKFIDAADPSATEKPNLTNHVRMAQRISTGGGGASVAGSLVGGQGSLAVNTDAGTFAFELGTTLIADSKRVLEAGADGAVLWAMEASVDRTLGGGEEPIFDGAGNIINTPPTNATGVRQTSRQAFARPNVARKVASSDYLIADTGNNRVIRTDRGGTVRWSLARFEDPYGLLASGEATTLNGPTDVQFYVTPTVVPGNAPTGYEIHYLIADAGNYRIIEVADYYDLGGQPIDAPGAPQSAGSHVLLWTTRTASSGKRYRFQSLQRFLGFGPAGSQQAGFYGYPYVSAIVSNSTVGTGSSETGSDFTGGAIVNLSYMPYNTTIALRNGNNSVPVTLWQGTPARDFEPIGNGGVLQTVESVNIIQTGSPVRKKRISAPIFFQQLNLPQRANVPARTLFLICDAEGAYVVEAETDPNTGKLVNNVLWMFTQADYDRINGVSPGTAYTDPNTGNLVTNPPGRGTVIPDGRINIPTLLAGGPVDRRMGELPRFQPSSIQLLPSGNYLITNSWAGRSSLFDSGQFTGEVFEVDPAGLSVLINTDFGDTRIGGTFANFAAPSILKGSNTSLTNTVPTGLNQQLMGNPKSNTGLLEQPLYSFRP